MKIADKKTQEIRIIMGQTLLTIIFLCVLILIIVTSPILIQHNPYKNQASFAQVIDPIYSHASYFGKSTGSNKRSVPINRTVSSNWHQRVLNLKFSDTFCPFCGKKFETSSGESIPSYASYFAKFGLRNQNFLTALLTPCHQNFRCFTADPGFLPKKSLK